MNELRAVEFPSGPAVLEGCLHRGPQGASRGAAIVCHPHPDYGGTMDNPVVVALAESLASTGFPALRFNFRGVGESGAGRGDAGAARQDVEAALLRMTSEVGSDVPMLIAGYSFGAWAGYPVACMNPGVSGVLCVAPPLDLLPMSLPAGPPRPLAKWFALGDRDEFCSLDTFWGWYRGLAGPKQVEVLPGADHFLRGREAAVGAAAAAFASATPAPRRS